MILVVAFLGAHCVFGAHIFLGILLRAPLASTLLVKWWVELEFCRFKTHTDEVVQVLVNLPSSAQVALKVECSGNFLERSFAFEIVV